MAQESTLPDMRSVRKRNGLEGKRLQHTLDKIAQEESHRVKRIKEQIRQASHESYYREIEKEKRARQLLATYVKIQRRRKFGDRWLESIANSKGDNSSTRRTSHASFTSLERERKPSIATLPPIQGKAMQLPNLPTSRESKPSLAPLPSPQKERRHSQVSFTLPDTGRESRESWVTLPSPSKESRNSALTLPSLGRDSRRSFHLLPSSERGRSRQSQQTLTPSDGQRRTSRIGTASSSREGGRRWQASSLPPIPQDRRTLASRSSGRRSSSLSSRRFGGSLDRIDSLLPGYTPRPPTSGSLPQVYVMQTFPYVYHSGGVKDCPRYTVFLEHKDRRRIAVKTKGRRRSTLVSRDDWAVFNSDRKRMSTQSLPSSTPTAATSGSQRKLQVAAKLTRALAKLKVIRL